MTSPDNLKACPFCGSEAKLYTQEVDPDSFCGRAGMASAFQVGCTNDNCGMGTDTNSERDFVIDAWNTRTPGPVLAELKRVSKFADSLKVKPDKYDYGKGMNVIRITIKAFVDSIISRLEPETKGGQDG